MQDKFIDSQKALFALAPKLVELFSHRFLSRIKTFYDASWLLFHSGTYILKGSGLAASVEESYTYFTFIKPSAVDLLKKGMDAKSIQIINTHIEKLKTIHKNSILNYEYVHSDKKDLTSQLKDSMKLYKKKYPTLSIIPEVFFYHNGLVYLPKAVLKRIEHTDVIDCGAYTGDSSLVFEKNYSFGKIYAFEPNTDNYNKLLKTIRRYQLRFVVPIQKGVSASETKGISLHSGVGSTVLIIKKPAKKDEVIEICTIDSYCHHVKGIIGVIKMDIEGFERDALKGAVTTIRKYKPVLLISIYHSSKDFFEIKPFIESLHLGYKFMIRKLNPYTSLYEIMLIAY